ncbi:MAG: hypothetical protein ABR548_09585 [Actinomycetota bacterium]|nr:hypothetical protein [Actinomycetota bacterium]
MHTVAIILNIDQTKAAEFEAGFHEHEVPIWKDLHDRGLIVRASLTPLEISTMSPDGVKQYLVNVVLKDGDAHHEHDGDPRFKKWNAIADQFQSHEPYVFGGDALIEI